MDRLPGFTAGLSLYTTERRYSSVPVRDSAPEGIQMAKLGETSYTNCGWTCIYLWLDLHLRLCRLYILLSSTVRRIR
jgi:hypothetical protein